MRHRITEYLTFFREFRESFQKTGALTPSGRSLSRKLCGALDERHGPRRVLEVGAGTGAVTREIAARLQPQDRLDVVEINPRFVEVLQRRFDTELPFRTVADQVQIRAHGIEDLPDDLEYDVIICGLPFNNFPVDLVKSILKLMSERVVAGGTLSFFEYFAVRPVRSLVTSGDERRRVARVGRVLEWYLDRFEYAAKPVLANVPPAIVHHLRFAEATQAQPASHSGASIEPAVSGAGVAS